MVKTNQDPLVRKTVATAMNVLPSYSADEQDKDRLFPAKGMEVMIRGLRGVGTASASLVLSVCTAESLEDEEIEQAKPGQVGRKVEVPFYSDEMYLWLCFGDYPTSARREQAAKAQKEKAESKKEVEQQKSQQQQQEPDNGDDGDAKETKTKSKKEKSKKPKSQSSANKPTRKPNGELNVKYNMFEYKNLWNAAWKLRERLNRENNVEVKEVKEEKEEKREKADPESKRRIFISFTDIEKVAYVISHIRLSGYELEDYAAEPTSSSTEKDQPQRMYEEVSEDIFTPATDDEKTKTKKEKKHKKDKKKDKKKDNKRKREEDDDGEEGEAGDKNESNDGKQQHEDVGAASATSSVASSKKDKGNKSKKGKKAKKVRKVTPNSA